MFDFEFMTICDNLRIMGDALVLLHKVRKPLVSNVTTEIEKLHNKECTISGEEFPGVQYRIPHPS